MLLPMLVFAQGSGSEVFPSEPENAPIDGGFSLLVSAGVGYRTKKWNEKRKKKLANTLTCQLHHLFNSKKSIEWHKCQPFKGWHLCFVWLPISQKHRLAL